MRFNQQRLVCVLILAFLCPSVALLPVVRSEESAGDLDGGEIETLVTDKTTQYSSLEVFPPADE